MPENEYPILAAFGVPIGSLELQWIGTLSVLWSQVEYCVEAAIYDLQNFSFTEGRRTTLPRDISKKAEKLAALAGDYCKPPERGAFLAICDRIKLLAPRRNLVVHGHWCRLSDHNDVPAAVSWFRVPVEEKVHRVLPGELPAITAEAGAISRALYDLLVLRGAFVLVDQVGGSASAPATKAEQSVSNPNVKPDPTG